MIMLVFFLLVAYDSQNIKYRKMLYYAFTAVTVGFVISMIALIFFVVFYDDIDTYYTDACLNNPDLYPELYNTLEECENFFHYLAIYCVVGSFFIAVPIRVMLNRVLYYGWKEQVSLRDQRINNFA